MAALLSFTDYVSASGTVFATDSEVDGLSASNVGTKVIQEPWRTGGAASFYVSMTFSAVRTVEIVAVAIPRSGVMPGASETVRLRITGGSGAVDTGAVAAGWDARRGTWLYRCSAGQTGLTVRLDFGGATSYRDIGRIWAGPALVPARNFEYNWTREWDDSGSNVYAPKSGARYVDSGVMRRKCEVAFPAMSDADAVTAEDGDFDVGATGQMLFCADTSNGARHTIIGTMQMTPVTASLYGINQKRYSIVEDL